MPQRVEIDCSGILDVAGIDQLAKSRVEGLAAPKPAALVREDEVMVLPRGAQLVPLSLLHGAMITQPRYGLGREFDSAARARRLWGEQIELLSLVVQPPSHSEVTRLQIDCIPASAEQF